MSVPRVSVVIPTYNRAGMIGETLASALAQTFTDYEIVVVDDGSTDGTRSVVEGVAPEARYVYQQNAGIPEVMNVCVREARGEYVQFLGSDDLLTPTTLARSTAVLDANRRVALVHGAAWLIDESGERFGVKRPGFAGGDYVRSGREEIRDLLFSNHIVAPTVMARRDVMLATGLFDARFRLYEDWNFWTQIAKQHDIAYIDEPLVNYRVHSGPSGSVFHTARTRDIDCYRRMHLDEVLEDPALRDVYAGIRRSVLAHHHLVVGRRAHGAGESWYARRSALNALLSDAGAAPAAVRLFGRTLVPAALVKIVRSHRQRSPEPSSAAASQTQVTGE